MAGRPQGSPLHFTLHIGETLTVSLLKNIDKSPNPCYPNASKNNVIGCDTGQVALTNATENCGMVKRSR